MQCPERQFSTVADSPFLLHSPLCEHARGRGCYDSVAQPEPVQTLKAQAAGELLSPAGQPAPSYVVSQA